MTMLLLMGCFERHIYGMPQSLFYGLPEEQKKEVIRNYKQRGEQQDYGWKVAPLLMT